MQVFDTSSRALLRQFKGHRQPVHIARFGPDKLHVLSASDDATVRVSETLLCQCVCTGLECTCSDARSFDKALNDSQVRWWDVTQGCQLQQLKGHTDYVRAACVNPSDTQAWATGNLSATSTQVSLCHLRQVVTPSKEQESCTKPASPDSLQFCCTCHSNTSSGTVRVVLSDME